MTSSSKARLSSSSPTSVAQMPYRFTENHVLVAQHQIPQEVSTSTTTTSSIATDYSTVSSIRHDYGVPGSTELNPHIEAMLDQMQRRFSEMGVTIMGRMDVLGSRIEELDRSIATLMEQPEVDPAISSSRRHCQQHRHHGLSVRCTQPDTDGLEKPTSAEI